MGSLRRARTCDAKRSPVGSPPQGRSARSRDETSPEGGHATSPDRAIWRGGSVAAIDDLRPSALRTSRRSIPAGTPVARTTCASRSSGWRCVAHLHRWARLAHRQPVLPRNGEHHRRSDRAVHRQHRKPCDADERLRLHRPERGPGSIFSIVRVDASAPRRATSRRWSSASTRPPPRTRSAQRHRQPIHEPRQNCRSVLAPVGLSWLLQIELPGHAMSIANPTEASAESVVVKRHEDLAALGE